jgi:hypothetical protein
MFLPEPYRGSCNALRAVNTGLSHFLCRTTGSQTVPMKMQDWIQKFDASLTFYEYEILQDAGKVRHDVAIRLAEKVYEKFRVVQDKNFESDFDKEVKKITKRGKDNKK